jgi:hypothetical protein
VKQFTQSRSTQTCSQSLFPARCCCCHKQQARQEF